MGHSHLAPRLSRHVTTSYNGRKPPNYSDKFLDSVEKPADIGSEMNDLGMPQTNKMQQSMWNLLDSQADERWKFSKTDGKLTNEGRESYLEDEATRKERYQQCEKEGNTAMAMQIYREVLAEGGNEALQQFDHDRMMELSLKENNMLMFLVFFAQTVQSGDSMKKAMHQVRNAQRLAQKENEDEARATKLALYAWCVAMQKVQFTDNLSQLLAYIPSTVEAKKALAMCVTDVPTETLVTIVKNSPFFQGLGYSLIEILSDEPKKVCAIYRALQTKTHLPLTTFGRVLVALTETGQYEQAEKLYHHPTYTSAECREEYVDHVAVVYAIQGKWEPFCELLTKKYCQMETNADSKALAAVLSRVRDTGGGPSLIEYVENKGREMLPFKMIMCMAAGDYPSAAELYGNANVVDPEPLLMHIILQVHDHTCEPEKALAVLAKSTVENITPLMLINAIQSCVGAYSRQDLVRMMRFVKDERVTQDVSVANAIIRALMRLGGWSEAITVFNHLGAKVDVNSYSELLMGLAYYQKYDEYKFYLTKLRNTKKLEINSEIFGTLMQVYVAQGRIKQAKSLLRSLENSTKINLAHYHYQYLMTYYSREGEHEEAQALYQRMITHGVQASGSITRMMLTNIKMGYNMEDATEAKAALVVMEAAALDIVETSDLLSPGVVSPFVREVIWYIERNTGEDKEKAMGMMENFLARYTEKHGGSESMRVLLWVLELESLKDDAPFSVAHACWDRLFGIARLRNERNESQQGFRPTKTSRKHAVIMGDALEIYAKILEAHGHGDKLEQIRLAFKRRRWSIPYALSKRE